MIDYLPPACNKRQVREIQRTGRAPDISRQRRALGQSANQSTELVNRAG